MVGLGKILVGLVAAAAVTTTVVVVATQDVDAADQAIVTKLIDGDTFDAEIGSRIERIRLLNIDTPETKDPDEDVQCLGPEAAKLLESLIPVGTTVTLEYDEERFDRHERTLAGVYTADGTLINAEVARQGLATAVVIGNNDRFYPPVLEAQEEAVAQGRGLYSADVACTILAAERRRAESADPPAPARDPAPDRNPYPGYTGPRCYEPGGKVWHPC